MSIPIIAGPVGYDSWYVKVFRNMCEIVGDPKKFVLDWIAPEKKLVVHTDRLDDTTLEAVTAMLERVLPKDVNVEHTNYILPAGYKKLEYLESTGTQYINTQFIPAEEAQIDIEFMDTMPTNNYRTVCGVNEVTTIGTWRFNIAYQNYTGIQAEYGWWYSIANLARDTKHRVFFKSVVNDYATCVHTVDGQLIPSDYTPSVMYLKGALTAGTEPLFLFARNTANKAPSVGDNHFTGRIYMVHLKNTNGNESYFMPTLDTTNTPCLYDLVSKQTFYNKGAGDFLYPGAEQSVQTTDIDATSYAQLTEHGVRRLYKVPDGCNMTKDKYAAANGFKELVEPPMPMTGHWTPKWRETETQLILEWIET